MNIHQLSVSHDERQDRLLLRLNTLDAQEFRFWLTRRMAIRLLPVMEQSVVRLEAAQAGMAAADPTTQQMLTELKREAFLQGADFSTPYSSQAQQLPLGSEPLLITDTQISLQGQGGLQMIFQQKSGEAVQSCQLNLQAPLVHGLIHLIRQSMAKADWGLGPGLVEPSEVKPLGAFTSERGYKH
jgi:hypothetical protein